MARQKPEIIITTVIKIIFSDKQDYAKFVFVTVPEDALDDGVLYSFQVSSVSLNNYEAYSKEYEILTPHYRVVQAITVGAVLLLILLALAVVLFYMKRHLFTPYHHDDKV